MKKILSAIMALTLMVGVVIVEISVMDNHPTELSDIAIKGQDPDPWEPS